MAQPSAHAGPPADLEPPAGVQTSPAEVRTRTNLALYRKYRSATFAEVIGQEHVTEPLSIALAAGRINHAYLFSGPRGCGKTSSARILARSLNCVDGPTPTPCGRCDSCRELAPNGPGSIDVIEIDAASHNGVDDARDLRERAYYSAVRDRYKVYIIDEAHMVTTNAFNALLKLIEEPPEFVVFVFATTEPDKVLPTIRSRTHHYPFRLVPPGVLRAHLERICALEGASVEQAVYPLVVRAGGGSVRDSLSLLDQLLAGAGPAGITYPRAVALLGVTDAALIDDMVDALAVGDAASVYGTVERVVEAGHEPRRFAADLLERLRDLLILDAVPEAGDNGLLDVPADALARMRDQAARIGGGTAAHFAEIVHTALVEMRGTTAPRLLLELVCARMLLPDASASAGALVQRLERLERRLQMASEPAGSAPPVVSVPPPVVSPPVVSVPPGAGVPAGSDDRGGSGLDVTAVRAIWPEVLDVVRQKSRRTRALLDSAQVARLDGNHIELVMATAPLVRMLGEPSNADVVTAALGQLLPGTWTLQVHVEATAELEAVPAPSIDGAQDGRSWPAVAGPTAPVPAGEPGSSRARAPSPAPGPPRAPSPATPKAGTSTAGTSKAGTSKAGVSAAGPSNAGPSNSGPSSARTSAATRSGTRGSRRSAASAALEQADSASPVEDVEPDDLDEVDPDLDFSTTEPDAPAGPRHDPEADALALLRDGLGARPLEG